MNDIRLAKFLGLFSLALGLFQMISGRRLAYRLGLRDSSLVKAFGAREVANGLAVLTQPDAAVPLWGRVAGDALDIAVLATALGSHNRQRHNAAWAALAVLGVTVLDVGVAASLTRRAHSAHQTAQRTRVRHAAAPT